MDNGAENSTDCKKITMMQRTIPLKLQ